MKGPRGFTLLELMIVVAVIAVLASIAIPAWQKESNRGRTDPEIAAMMTEISNKEEQYKSELGNGDYMTAADCPGAPTPMGADWNLSCNSVAGWNTLRVSAPDSTIRCSYQVTADTPPTAPFTMNIPAGNYYWIVATCDMDGQGGTNSTFFRSSTDTALQKNNYGQ